MSTTGTDSDFEVKIVDVYPGDYPTPEPPEGQPMAPNAVKMGGYQQLVRGEPFRAKFRNGFEKGEPMVSGEPTTINFELPAVYHTFRKGHRMMVQVQSSWFLSSTGILNNSWISQRRDRKISTKRPSESIAREL